MSDDKSWKEIGAGGDIWDYSNKETPMEKGSEFVGIYVSKQEDVGENHSYLYDFEDGKGNLVQVWGSTLLDARLKNVVPGEEVKLVYLGREDSQKRKGKTYHNFQVFHRPQPFKEVSSDQVNSDEITEENF